MIKKIIIISLLMNAYILQAQILFSDNFNDGNLDGWTNIDNDTDPPVSPGVDYDLWYASDIYSGFVKGLDDAAAVSHSLGPKGSEWIAYKPNNFLISPVIDLSTASSSNLKLKFEAGSGQQTGRHAEHYAVYVTTSKTIADIEAATPVFEETLPSGEEMFSHVIDISKHSGENVYVTFRHYDCTNQFILLINDVIVEQILDDNASIKSLSLNRYSLKNIDNTIDINITNNGANEITSLTIDWNDGSAHSSTITGLSIPQFSNKIVSHPTFVKYSTIVEKEITVTVTDVNGASNSETIKNISTTNINTISQKSNKKVLLEESTGTWCPGCPAGTVMMDDMTTSHPDNLIGISVHVREDDPMNLHEYEIAADFFAAPKVHVDRKYLNEDVFDAESLYNKQKPIDVPATLKATISGPASNLAIKTSAIFRSKFAKADFRLGVIIIEDHVTGTTSDYDQNNTYAGGTYGPMGGFEKLPNPVPANQMEYNHVGRALLGGYSGQANSVPTSIEVDQDVTYTFNYTIPSTSNIENMRAVVVLIDQSNGEIINAETASFNVGIENINTIETSIYPNPTSDILNIKFDGEAKEYLISLFNVDGKTVLTKKINATSNKVHVTISTKDLQEGTYFINISTKGKSTSKKIVIN